MADLTGKYESEADDALSPEHAALMSIAISLKRIADELEGGRPHRQSIFELIADRMPSQ